MQDDVTIMCVGFYSQFCEVLYIFQDILIKYTHCGAMKILSLFVNYYKVIPRLKFYLAIFSSILKTTLYMYVILQEKGLKSFEYEEIELDNTVLCFDTPN